MHGQGQILMTLSPLMYEPYLILYTNQIFLSGILFVSHIESRFIPLLTCLLHCCLELTVLWVSVTAFNSKVRLAQPHGRPVLCGWARLVVPVGFGMSRRFARSPSTASSACPRSQGACTLQPSRAVEEHRGVPPGVCRLGCILCVCHYYLFALYIFVLIVVY